MLFKIKAKKDTGEIIEGVREAPDRLTLSRDIRAENLTLFFAEGLSRPEARKKWWSFLANRVGLKEKIVFAGNLSSMITAGLSLSRALEVLERQTKQKYFKNIVYQILQKVNMGESFSNALNAWPEIFPPVFSAMVAAGEESGNLPQSLAIIKDQMNKTYELRRKIVGAMIYPAIIVLAIIVIAILMLIFMVPQLAATFRDLNVQLPLSTRLIIGISDWLANHYLLFSALVIALIGLSMVWLRSVNGQRTIDRLAIRMPIFGDLIKQYNSAVIMRTLSSLISAGVKMTDSITITEKVVQNTLYKPFITRAATEIQKGLVLSVLFETEPKLFPVLVPELTAVEEETGNLPNLLAQGAAFYEGEVDQVTKNLSTIIEPFLMIVIGIAVGFFVVSMIGPMYSLSSAIK